MTDKFSIDSHKLMYHPERLASFVSAGDKWEKAKKIYPIYVEISTSGFCNHRCKFCALDYLGYKTGMADFENLKKAIKDMAKGGVKSIQFGGEGEPLLHPRVVDIVRYTRAQGVDISFTTNGGFLKKEILTEILPLTTWIKVSVDAGTPETHAKIHRPKAGNFEDVMDNLKQAVGIRKSRGLKVTLGAQMLLLPDNYKEAITLANKAKKIGLDYLVIKPYSQHKKSVTREYENISYKKYLSLADELKKLNSDKFQVIFRRNTMEKLAGEKKYKVCHATPFMWAYIMANGDVYSCSSFLGDKEFNLGNYNKKSFKEIWEGEGRRKHWKFVQNKLDITICRENCRMDEVNRYLEKLKNPPEHVNFI